MTSTGDQIVSTLKGFGITATLAGVDHGARVDRWQIRLAPGQRSDAVTKLAPDLALATSAQDVRVLAIPGTPHIGVEVPAAEPRTVTLADVQENLPADHPLRFPVGEAIGGDTIHARLDRLPHLLVAGTTGSGKSVFTTGVLAHLVTHADPADVQLALIDPKRVELAAFSRVPHLRAPVAVDVEDAIALLEGLVVEMTARYRTLEARGHRNIDELADRPPYVVVVVDELADLMMTGKKRAEDPIVRLLQMGRAAGIHLILATQRPSTDVVTGLIKTNAPSRMVFSVSSHTDSSVALGQSGAQALLGQGDGLWWPSGARAPERIQAPYVSTQELSYLLDPWAGQDQEEDAQMDLLLANDPWSGLEGMYPPPPPAERRQAAGDDTQEIPTMTIPDSLADEPMSYDDRIAALEERMASERMIAYETGLANAAAVDSRPMAVRRMMKGSDWLIGFTIFVFSTGLAQLMVDLLPILVGGFITYVSVRQLRTIKPYTRRNQP